MKSPAIGINYDTGNSNLAGTTDTYEWLNHVKDRLVHWQAKDISFSKSKAEKGKLSELQWVAHAAMALWIGEK